jgi:transcriptional regulator with XRE-family HTH domain
MSLQIGDEGVLGAYLRDRRAKLDPAAFGLPLNRRRTPGLRREEVAQRAHVSAAWYTWLEQGRGGAPSADVLDRIARALMLTDAEREHLFVLGLGSPPEIQYHESDDVSPRLQRVLDAFEWSPALIKNSTWDVLAWNRAAAAMLTDYSKLPVKERNILRLMFTDARVRSLQEDWQSVARFVVAVFRADAARAGASETIKTLVNDFSRQTPEFAAMWADVRRYGGGLRHLHHPLLGKIVMEFSAFAVDGRADLSMIVYNPATPADAERVRSLLEAELNCA